MPVSKLCIGLTLFILTLSWCLLDNWNHQVSSQLFNLEAVKDLHVNPGTGDLETAVDKFSYPLALAFAQFIFMGVFFLLLWYIAVPDAYASLTFVKFSGKHWAGVVTTHVFSTF